MWGSIFSGKKPSAPQSVIESQPSLQPQQTYDNPLPGQNENQYTLGATYDPASQNPYSLGGAVDYAPITQNPYSLGDGEIRENPLYDNSAGLAPPSPTPSQKAQEQATAGYLLIGDTPVRIASSSTDPQIPVQAFASVARTSFANVYSMASADPENAYSLASASAPGNYDSFLPGESEYLEPSRFNPHYVSTASNGLYAESSDSQGLYSELSGGVATLKKAAPGLPARSHCRECGFVQGAGHAALCPLKETATIVSQQPLPMSMVPVKSAGIYPEIECCSRNYARCLSQHCGCLQFWNPAAFKQWWRRHYEMCCPSSYFKKKYPATAPASSSLSTDMSMSFTNPVYGMSDTDIAPTVISIDQLKKAGITRLGRMQTLYAALGCMGCSKTACIQWSQDRTPEEIDARLTRGQLIVDGCCVAIVIAGGTFWFWKSAVIAAGTGAVALESQTGGDYNGIVITTPALNISGNTTALPPVSTSYVIPPTENGRVTTTLAPTATITTSTHTTADINRTTTWVSTSDSTVQIVTTTTPASNTTTVYVSGNATTTSVPTQAPSTLPTVVTTSLISTITAIPASTGTVIVTTSATMATNVTVPIGTSTISVSETSPVPLPTSGTGTLLSTTITPPATGSETFATTIASPGTNATAILPTTTLTTATVSTGASTTTTIQVTNSMGATVQVTATSTVTPAGVISTSTLATTANVQISTTAAAPNSVSTAVLTTITPTTTGPVTTTSIPTTTGTITVTSTTTTTKVTTTTPIATTVLTQPPTTTTTTTVAPVTCRVNRFQPCCPSICLNQPANSVCANPPPPSC